MKALIFSSPAPSSVFEYKPTPGMGVRREGAAGKVLQAVSSAEKFH